MTIIEGITGKSMMKVKSALPKTQINNENFKVFSNNTILFDKRIYSKFNLSLKYIKLRKDLNDILTTFGIYILANKYRNIYDTFMNLGVILRADTLEDISNSNSFPDADKLIELERKFADILNEEDLTGLKSIKKNDNIKKLLISFDEINNKNDRNNKSNNTHLYKFQNKKSNLIKSMKLMPIKKKINFIFEGEKEKNKLEVKHNDNYLNFLKKVYNPQNKRYLTLDDINNKEGLDIRNNFDNKNSNNLKSIKIDIDNIINNNSLKKNNKLENSYKFHTIENDINNKRLKRNKITLNKNRKVFSQNFAFIKILKKRENKIISPKEIFNRNIKILNKMNRKKSFDRFCLPFKGEYDAKKEILFSPSKLNYYEELVKQMREKYIKDKDHFYTYSEKTLTLNFPMIESFRNEEYIKYIDNKSKWIADKDFDRYKQPEREKIFFPRINKEI